MSELQQPDRGRTFAWPTQGDLVEPWDRAGVPRETWLEALRACAGNYLRETEKLRGRGTGESHEAAAEYDQVRAGDPGAVQRWIRMSHSAAVTGVPPVWRIRPADRRAERPTTGAAARR